MNQAQPATDAEDWDVIITFVPRDARLEFVDVHESKGKAYRRLFLRVDLVQGEDVRLPDDRSLKNLEWLVQLNEAHTFNDTAEKEGAIGFVFHLKERNAIDDYSPESCCVSAALKPDRFTTLLNAIQSGHLPEKIDVTVRGMGFGWEPDGAGKIWNLERNPRAPVTMIGFTIPLSIQHPFSLERLNETSIADGLPASAGDIRSLEGRIAAAIADLSRNTANRWRALFALLVTVIILLVFRR